MTAMILRDHPLCVQIGPWGSNHQKVEGFSDKLGAASLLPTPPLNDTEGQETGALCGQGYVCYLPYPSQ